MNLFGFELGNGWIISVFILVVSYVPVILGGKAAKRLVNFSFASTRGKAFSVIMSVFFIFWLGYPLFLRIRFNTVPFYIGLVFLAAGAVFTITSFINYFSTPLDQTIEKGMYRISRNPIYIFTTLMFIGFALIIHSWIIGITIGLNILMQHFIILEEEQFCEQTYGESYIEFKNRVPRYLFF